MEDCVMSSTERNDDTHKYPVTTQCRSFWLTSVLVSGAILFEQTVFRIVQLFRRTVGWYTQQKGYHPKIFSLQPTHWSSCYQDTQVSARYKLPGHNVPILL